MAFTSFLASLDAGGAQKDAPPTVAERNADVPSGPVSVLSRTINGAPIAGEINPER